MPSNPQIDIAGNKWWYNEEGYLHRLDGPAFIATSGYQAWLINGRRHRIDGPAIIWENGTVEYWINDIRFHTEQEYWNKIKQLGLFQAERQPKQSRFKRLEVK